MADTSIERFRRVVEAAYGHLEQRRQEVNDLNVFPVADGDTGDNMALTMRAVMSELDRLDGQPIDTQARETIVHAVARAALMGARGNSGVILSQIVRGAAEELASRPGSWSTRCWSRRRSRAPPTPPTNRCVTLPRERC